MLTAVVLGVASSGTAAGGPTAAVTPFPVECTLAGTHYLGTTRQGHKVCLTVSANGKVLREFSFGTRSKCSDGKRRVGATSVKPRASFSRIGVPFVGWDRVRTFPINASGAFTATFLPPPDPATFSGRIRQGAAAGVLRLRVEELDGASLTCDTGTVAWSAKRTAKP